MLHIHPEIQGELAAGRPVVALETAVLTHGLPRPHHLDAITRMSAAVRRGGAAPAVIAAMDGRLNVGLDPAQLGRLAASTTARKLAARDLALALADRTCGGTTVSATLVAARLAGIRAFATGGIGGVHRGWQRRLDVSGDLLELARTPCVVVSAGAKSILDLPATLEALEALGVPVLGWRSERLPRFYTRGLDDLKLPRVDDLERVAELCRLRWGALGQPGGVLLANPIAEEHALDDATLEAAIEAAVERARAQQIHGAALTPFLLSALEAATEGRSVAANLALLEANAHLAAQLAVHLATAP